MVRSPLLLLGAAAALGAAATQPLGSDVRLLVLCASVALCVWLALTRAELGRLRAAAAVALVAGGASALLHGSFAAPSFKEHTTRLACTILSDDAIENGNDSYTCATDAGSKLALSSRGAISRVGTRVLVRGRIEPFDGPRNPGEPDERAIQLERGIVARMSGARILRVLPDGPLGLDLIVARAHAWALEQLRLRLPEPSR